MNNLIEIKNYSTNKIRWKYSKQFNKKEINIYLKENKNTIIETNRLSEEQYETKLYFYQYSNYF